MATLQKIYVGQTALSIQFDTKIDLTTQTAVKIKYIKPDGTTGDWTAGVVGDPTDGIIGYDIVSNSDLDQAELWQMWAYVTFAGGTVAPGDSVAVWVHTEGT